MCDTLFFTDPPNLSTLCALTVTIPGDLHQNGSLASKQQPQVIKCREFIFTDPEILATPVFGNEQKLHIILQQHLYKTGRLQARIERMGLHSDDPTHVTPALYQACLRYTMLARLAPSWNKCGELLVQGRDFLTSTEKLNAIAFDVVVKEKEMYFSLKPCVIKSAPIKLEDLEVCPPVIQTFLSLPQAVIQEYSIENKWCYVLPSMKRGKVIKVHHTLPDDGPFKTYRDLKRHWKNTHGYRLPETDEDILYLQIYFKPIGQILFTYPHICIRSKEVITFPRTDPQPILQAFFADLKAKMPTICGQRLNLQPKANYTIAKLLEAGEIKNSSDTQTANLTTAIPTKNYDYKRQYIPNTWSIQLSTKARFFNSAAKKSLENNSQKSVSSCTFSSQLNLQMGQNISDSNNSQALQHVNTQQAADRNEVPGKYQDSIPMHLSSTGVSLDTTAKVPGSIERGTSDCLHTQNEKAETADLTVQTLPSNKENQKFRPVFKPVFKKKTNPFNVQNSNNVPHPQKLKPVFSHHIVQKLAPGSLYNPSPPLQPKAKSSKQQRECDVQCNQTQGSSSSSSIPKTRLPTASSTFITGPNTSAKTPIVPKLPNTSQPNGNASLASPATAATQYLSTAKMTNTSGCSKRTNEDPSMPAVKKPRPKPKVQELDVEELARGRQLSKVNSATLLAWLKARGVQCKAKDKKTDLIDKVNLYLNLTVPSEQ